MSVVVPWRRVCPDLPWGWVAQLGVSENGWALRTPKAEQLRWGEAAVTERSRGSPVLGGLCAGLALRNYSFTMTCVVKTNKKCKI